MTLHLHLPSLSLSYFNIPPCLGQSNIDLTCELRPRAIMTQARGWRHSCIRTSSKNGDKEASQVEIVVRTMFILCTFDPHVLSLWSSSSSSCFLSYAFISLILAFCIHLADPGLQDIDLIVLVFMVFYFSGLLYSSPSAFILFCINELRALVVLTLI